MNSQCQSCGAFSGGLVPTAPCTVCGATICANCKSNHTQGCEERARRSKNGGGATVRTVTNNVPTLPAPVQEGEISPVIDPLSLLESAPSVALAGPIDTLLFAGALAVESVSPELTAEQAGIGFSAPPPFLPVTPEVTKVLGILQNEMEAISGVVSTGDVTLTIGEVTPTGTVEPLAPAPTSEPLPDVQA